jgi:hypothetical protein
MTPKLPQPGASRGKSSHKTDASFNAPPADMQQQYRHQAGHHDTANAANINIPQDRDLKIVHKSTHSKNIN